MTKLVGIHHRHRQSHRTGDPPAGQWRVSSLSERPEQEIRQAVEDDGTRSRRTIALQQADHQTARNTITMQFEKAQLSVGVPISGSRKRAHHESPGTA